MTSTADLAAKMRKLGFDEVAERLEALVEALTHLTWCRPCSEGSR
jgi:hypothetical protein